MAAILSKNSQLIMTTWHKKYAGGDKFPNKKEKIRITKSNCIVIILGRFPNNKTQK
jgi:hypothetical protein